MATMFLAGLSLASLNAQAPATQPPPPGTIVCSSPTAARHHCAGDTSAGVVLAKTTGAAACLLGKTWGYDDQGVWVSDGCSGEFLTGAAAAAQAATGAAVGADGTDRVVGRVQSGQRLPGRARQRRRTGDQRLRAGSLPEPDAGQRYLHRSSWQRTRGRRPERHLPAPRHHLVQGLGRAAANRLQHRDLDGEHHQPGARCSAISATSSTRSSASTPGSTAILERGRCKARIRIGWATIE